MKKYPNSKSCVKFKFSGEFSPDDFLNMTKFAELEIQLGYDLTQSVGLRRRQSRNPSQEQLY
jgi:hypothetical protein